MDKEQRVIDEITAIIGERKGEVTHSQLIDSLKGLMAHVAVMEGALI